MTTAADVKSHARIPLTRERVLSAAMAVADAGGVDSLTMRRIADELDVEAMSLYRHTPNKEAILDGIVDLVFTEAASEAGAVSDLTEPSEWREAVRGRILAARAVMLRHPWAPAVVETRVSLGLPMARHVDAVVGLFTAGGFDYNQIHHAMHALGSRLYGFSQELAEPTADDGGLTNRMAQLASAVPNLVAMFTQVSHDDPSSTLGWCDDQVEFEFGLDLLLDGLERIRT